MHFTDDSCTTWQELSSVVSDPATAYVSDTEPVAPPDPARFVFKRFNPDDKSAAGLFARAPRSPNGGDAELGELCVDIDITGDPTPSRADVELTTRLREVATSLGFRFSTT
jgi:hypothetical protein